MKISVILINRIIIMAIVSIVLIGAIPYLSFHLLEKHVVDEAIITFNKHAEPVDSLYTDEFLNNPRGFEEFEYERLSLIEDLIELDLSEPIKKSKEPFGNPWLLSILGKIFHKMVINLSRSTMTAYIRNRMLSSILSLLSLVFVFILGKELLKKMNREKDDAITPHILSKLQVIYRFIVSIMILTSGCYLLIYLIRNLITFIKYPPILHYPPVNATGSFVFEVIVILVGIVIMNLILHIILSKKNNQSKNYMAFFWTVPVLAIIFNLYMDNYQISMINNMIDSQNLNSIRQKLVNNAAEITYTSQQWYLQNETKYNMHEFLKSYKGKLPNPEYGTLEMTAEDTLLTIMATGKYVTKEGIYPQVKATYNTVKDSTAVSIIK